MPYVPATPDEVQRMLDVLGFSTVDALFDAIVPAGDRLRQPLGLPAGLVEADLVEAGTALAAQCTPVTAAASFLGAGAYRHHVPAVIRHLVSRGEYLTAYTPYQPEISQGTLQAIWEYQSLVCDLFAMDVANASVYDGASALAEAMLMSWRIGKGKRPRVILAGAIHPDALEVCCTYGHAGIVRIEAVPPGPDGRVDLEALRRSVGPDTACVAVQSPNFVGLIEDLPEIAAIAHEAGALQVVSVPDPHACALFEAPGASGADIVVGEGQPLGLPISFGGPYVGLFATRNAYVRQMPGRLVGRTRDVEGRQGFVLTLATREQHIRREKATSNICTNQGLCALQVAMYLALQGPEGLREVAEQCHAKALYLKRAVDAIPGFRVPYKGPFFHEFLVETPCRAADLVEDLAEEGIFAGVPLSRWYPARTHEMLVCATETSRREEMDRLVARLAAVQGGAR
ncbi:MAG: aminomethyl-transferring glycine dehydrogenase subunit GcvPA [Deltaproteobacteria bacterium]|nr:aminomethyl-transferring glycine dehydrogenase subunit GcvPA [Deltaproteobacteria bacterium]